MYVVNVYVRACKSICILCGGEKTSEREREKVLLAYTWRTVAYFYSGVGAVYYHLIPFIFRREDCSKWKILVCVLISTIDNINKNYKWSLYIKVLDIHYL